MIAGPWLSAFASSRLAICRSAGRGLAIIIVALSAGCTSGDPVGWLGPISIGNLALGIDGLPPGSAASVVVSGANGFQRTVTAAQTLTGLSPGSYTVQAQEVTVDGDRYTPAPASQSVAVTAGSTPVSVSVGYVLVTGRLTVTVSGVPTGSSAAIVVNGPQGFGVSVTGSVTLTTLVPGPYQISSGTTSVGGVTYLPVPGEQSVSVSASATPEVRTVTYSQGTGSLAVTIVGLPGGTPAGVSVTGPGGYSQNLTATQTIGGLLPGTYTVSATSVSAGGNTYAPVPLSQNVGVSIGGSARAAVTYAASAGALAVTIGGLPGGVSANVTVTGPGGFNQVVTNSQTLSGLTAGGYAVAAAPVVSGPTTYNPSPLSQNVSVVVGSTASASVAYSGGGGTAFNLQVNGVYLTQATQRFDGSVPLVAGRNAYLRVFALANQVNSAQPQVRVRLYNGSTLVQTYTIAAPAVGVPTVVNEGSLASSWNVLVPGALVQPNLKVLADVDPALAIAESDDADNGFPLSGTPGPVDVRSLPTFQVRFIPVLQQANGLSGSVSGATTESFLADLKQMLPVAAYSADVRAVYTSTAPVLQSDNGNGAWATILNEVLALKAADASTRYYYGVVRTSYGSGVAGLGYVGGSARTAIGWDYLPSGSGIMAHEVGHNMSRLHAPCGGASSPDPAFPYVGAKIGVWGLDLTTLSLKSPATYVDLMGYCSPDWVSDYNWSGMVTYRQAGPTNILAETGGAAPGLLVWGRIGSAGVVLEPAFTLASASGRAPTPGPNRLELLAADGSVLRTVAFESDAVADLPGGAERHFAFVIPLDAGLDRTLAGLRVRSGGRSVARVGVAGGADPSLELARPNPQQVELRWDAARYPMVMVRDAATGDILSFARGGTARLWSRGTGFTFHFSNGATSVVRQGRILR